MSEPAYATEKTFSQDGKDAVARLRARWNLDDPWDYDPGELAPLQMAAIKSRFEERCGQLPVLKQRASDTGIEKIEGLHDIVPLLFSHTNYKSYSPSFIAKGRWDLMTRWLGNLSVRPLDNVDLTGVNNIYDWVAALRKAGHLVLCSSGTTGQSSFVNYAPADDELQRMTIAKSFEVATGQKPENKFQAFFAAPRLGPTMVSQQLKLTSQLFAAPGGDHYISERSTSIADLDRMAALRRAMAAGTATPDMIQNAEAETKTRAAEMDKLLSALLDKILAHRHEPIIMLLIPAMLWRLVQHGRAQGIPDGSFHPNTIVRSGGGRKGAKLPDDFRDEAQKFIGVSRSRWVENYGMTELTSQFIKCREERFHCPPTVMPLILDKSGSSLVEHTGGMVEGRGAFFDIGVEGYWGGVITGDRLKFNFGPCSCGRKSPSVVEVSRYSDLPEGDDKLTCAGHIDTYIRGFTGSEEEK